jgi:hypothetical protein
MGLQYVNYKYHLVNFIDKSVHTHNPHPYNWSSPVGA